MSGTQDDDAKPAKRSSVAMVDGGSVDDDDLAVVMAGETGEVSERHLAMLERLSTTADEDWEDGEFEIHLEELLKAGLLASDASWL